MTHVNDCCCEENLRETFRAFSRNNPNGVIYQTSLMSALLSGVYEGNTTIKALLEHGDFGLGTFNELDGELIAFNSEVYQLRADGSAREANPQQKTPFAVMTGFYRSIASSLINPSVGSNCTTSLINRSRPTISFVRCALMAILSCPYPHRAAPDAALPCDDRRARRSTGVPLQPA